MVRDWQTDTQMTGTQTTDTQTKFTLRLLFKVLRITPKGGTVQEVDKNLENNSITIWVICGWGQSSPLHRWYRAFTSHQIFLMQPLTTNKGILPKRLPPNSLLNLHCCWRLICSSTLLQHHLLVPFVHFLLNILQAYSISITQYQYAHMHTVLRQQYYQFRKQILILKFNILISKHSGFHTKSACFNLTFHFYIQ